MCCNTQDISLYSYGQNKQSFKLAPTLFLNNASLDAISGCSYIKDQMPVDSPLRVSGCALSRATGRWAQPGTQVGDMQSPRERASSILK